MNTNFWYRALLDHDEISTIVCQSLNWKDVTRFNDFILMITIREQSDAFGGVNRDDHPEIEPKLSLSKIVVDWRILSKINKGRVDSWALWIFGSDIQEIFNSFLIVVDKFDPSSRGDHNKVWYFPLPRSKPNKMLNKISRFCNHKQIFDVWTIKVGGERRLRIYVDYLERTNETNFISDLIKQAATKRWKVSHEGTFDLSLWLWITTQLCPKSRSERAKTNTRLLINSFRCRSLPWEFLMKFMSLGRQLGDLPFRNWHQIGRPRLNLTIAWGCHISSDCWSTLSILEAQKIANFF